MEYDDFCCYKRTCCVDEKTGYRGLYDISQQQLRAEREKNKSLQAQLDAIRAVLNIK